MKVWFTKEANSDNLHEGFLISDGPRRLRVIAMGSVNDSIVVLDPQIEFFSSMMVIKGFEEAGALLNDKDVFHLVSVMALYENPK
jgi:hypothetical protein